MNIRLVDYVGFMNIRLLSHATELCRKLAGI